MLAIGELAVKAYVPDFNVSHIELITDTKHIPFLKNTFNCRVEVDTQRDSVKRFITSDPEAKAKQLTLYLSDKNTKFDSLRKYHFDNKGITIPLNPIYHYELLRQRVRKIYFNIDKWESLLKQRAIINNMFRETIVKETNNISDFYSEIYELCNLDIDIKDKTYSNTKYNDNDDLRMYADAFKLGKVSLFSGILYNDIYVYSSQNDATWRTYNYPQKKLATLEAAYIVLTKEYIIPQYRKALLVDAPFEVSQFSKADIFYFFKHTLMNLASVYNFNNISNFIIENYFKLVKDFNYVEYIDGLTNLLNKGQSLNNNVILRTPNYFDSYYGD